MSGAIDYYYDPFRDFATQQTPDLSSYNATAGFTGAGALSEQQVLGMTVGEYRAIINQGIAAVQQIDWQLTLNLANDPQFAGLFTGDALAVVQTAAATGGASIVAIFQDALSFVEGYSSSTLIGEITGDYSTDAFDEDVFADVYDQIRENLDSTHFDFTQTNDQSFFESPTFDYDPISDTWRAYDEGGFLDLSGTGSGGFLETVGNIFGDAVVTILGSKPGFLGGLTSTGSTIKDFADARELGARTGTEYGDLLQFGVEDVFEGRASLDEFDQRAESAVKNFISGLIGFVPGGSYINGIFFGSQNSDPTFQFGDDGAALAGSEHGDRFIFSSQGDVFAGGIGKDALFGMGGADDLKGEEDEDLLSGGAGHDTLSGGGGDDQMLGGAGRDLVRGNKGDDVIDGGDGTDKLLGQAGNDSVTGGTGDDIAKGGGGNDRLFGEVGDDFLKGGADDDLAQGGRGNDVVAGNKGNDLLFGAVGRDKLNGGGGNDTLNGGEGDDTLKGGAGADDFFFGPDFGTDVIKDFGAGDQINLSAFGALDLSIVQNASDVVNGDLRIDLGDGNVIWLEGRGLGALTDDAFIF